MYYLAYILLGVIIGLLIRLLTDRQNRKQREYYQSFIDQYLNAETVIHAHIREHILRERDLSWGVGLPPIITFGIKSDGSLMCGEELAEARRIAGI